MGGYPPITHPAETFTLWQAHTKVADVPIDWAGWDVGSSDMVEKLYNHGYIPYDPHNPQMPPASSGVNWTDSKEAAGYWGPAYIKANFSEIEFSTRDEDRRGKSPIPPVVLRLKAQVAREFGLLQAWFPAMVVPTPNVTVRLSAPYDLDSLKWPLKYPDANLLEDLPILPSLVETQ